MRSHRLPTASIFCLKAFTISTEIIRSFVPTRMIDGGAPSVILSVGDRSKKRFPMRLWAYAPGPKSITGFKRIKALGTSAIIMGTIA